MNATAPFFFPFMGAEGADLDKGNKVESASYPYPILMTYERQDATSIHAMTKVTVDTFDDYKSAAPGNMGWAVDRQNFA